MVDEARTAQYEEILEIIEERMFLARAGEAAPKFRVLIPLGLVEDVMDYCDAHFGCTMRRSKTKNRMTWVWFYIEVEEW